MALINQTAKRWIGIALSTAIVTGAVALGSFVVREVAMHPRTDDCEIVANYIGIAPQVDGPIVHLRVRDNQLLQKGD